MDYAIVQAMIPVSVNFAAWPGCVLELLAVPAAVEHGGGRLAAWLHGQARLELARRRLGDAAPAAVFLPDLEPDEIDECAGWLVGAIRAAPRLPSAEAFYLTLMLRPLLRHCWAESARNINPAKHRVN